MLLFLLYINDLPNDISSELKLYADDTLSFRVICSTDDIAIIQRDLNSLSQWADTWQMVSKCVYLRIGRKMNSPHSVYSLLGHTLKQVSSAK